MHFPSRRDARALVGVLLALGAAACSVSTGPSGSLSDLQARLRGVHTVFAAPVVQSAGSFLRGSPVLGPPAGGPLVPDSLLGKTFAYGCATQRYAVSADTGAPATGVRLTLYQLDADGAIACPASTVGALDLFDASTSDTAAVRAVASGADGTPYVAYTIGRAVAGSQGMASAAGWVSDGQRRLDVAVSTGPASGFNVSNYTLQLDDSAAGLHEMLRDAWQMGVDTHADSLELVVSQSGVTLELVGSTWWANGDRSWHERVSVNGEPFAAVSGNVMWGNGQPTVTSLGPTPLTDAERQLVLDLVDEPGDLSQSLSRMLGLGAHLVPLRF